MEVSCAKQIARSRRHDQDDADVGTCRFGAYADHKLSASERLFLWIEVNALLRAAPSAARMIAGIGSAVVVLPDAALMVEITIPPYCTSYLRAHPHQ